MDFKEAKEIITKYTFSNSFDLFPRPDKSHGSYLYDEEGQQEYIDLASFYASRAIAYNHPKLSDKDYQKSLLLVNDAKIPSKDYFSIVYAHFIKEFMEFLPEELRAKLFLIDTGSLAVESAIKTAMYYKKNKLNLKKHKNFEIIYFDNSFHGFTGYAMNVTDIKSSPCMDGFNRFNWKCFTPPVIDFKKVFEDDTEKTAKAISKIEKYLKVHSDNIAGIIIEPIQGVCGDNYFPKAFFKELRRLSDTYDCLLIFDEIQTGLGITGKNWACENYDTLPDILCFGKKTQICGIAVNEKVLSTEKNCFNEICRLDGTFSGSFVDYIRAAKIFQIIKEENLVNNAKMMGEYFLAALKNLQKDNASILKPRGKGLFLAFDMPDKRSRDEFVLKCEKEFHLLVLKTGETGVRIRGALDIDKETIDKAVEKLGLCLDLIKN